MTYMATTSIYAKNLQNILHETQFADGLFLHTKLTVPTTFISFMLSHQQLDKITCSVYIIIIVCQIGSLDDNVMKKGNGVTICSA